MKPHNRHTGITLHLQRWLFKKQRINILLLIIFLLAGLYGLYQGAAFKYKQLRTIESFRNEKLQALRTLQ
jgi:hypothetical protein